MLTMLTVGEDMAIRLRVRPSLCWLVSNARIPENLTTIGHKVRPSDMTGKINSDNSNNQQQQQSSLL